jgi:hypothetical protein
VNNLVFDKKGKRMKYFKMEEIVDKNTFENFGRSAWPLFPPYSLDMLDNLREFFGVPVIVNNWLEGGQFQFRGYRPSWCNVGSSGSYHRKGMAFDCDVEGYTAEEARQKILANQDNELLKLINRMEANTSWLHTDCKPLIYPQERIYVFNP